MAEQHGCGGVLEAGVTMAQYRLGAFLLMHEAPAMVCSRCGERLIDRKVVDDMQQGRRLPSIVLLIDDNPAPGSGFVSTQTFTPTVTTLSPARVVRRDDWSSMLLPAAAAPPVP